MSRFKADTFNRSSVEAAPGLDSERVTSFDRAYAELFK
jgi:hypothetical protein